MIEYSRFNHVIRISSGFWALYNFQTGVCLELDILTKDTYDHALSIGKSDSFVRKLLKCGFLVEYDELDYLRNRSYMFSCSPEVLTLCICPTMACNFACPYCFENKHSGVMTDDIQKSVIEFVSKQIQQYNHRKLYVTWYGGEPLLALDVIENLSKAFLDICSKANISYYAEIITNGYFFDDKSCKRLEECKVSKAQITLDGPYALLHDKTRKLIDGTGSFDRIINNLSSVKTSMKLDIRCNVHRDNKDSFAELEKLVNQMREKTGNRIGIYPSIVDDTFTRKEGAETLSLLSRTDFQDEFAMKRLSKEKLCFSGNVCMAQKVHAFLIDNRGDLYKCWELAGKDGCSFGNVSDFDFFSVPDGRIEQFLTYQDTVWPADDSECLKCVLLPACMGGCPKKRVISKKHICRYSKSHIDEYVRNAYDRKYTSSKDE